MMQRKKKTKNWKWSNKMSCDMPFRLWFHDCYRCCWWCRCWCCCFTFLRFSFSSFTQPHEVCISTTASSSASSLLVLVCVCVCRCVSASETACAYFFQEVFFLVHAKYYFIIYSQDFTVSVYRLNEHEKYYCVLKCGHSILLFSFFLHFTTTLLRLPSLLLLFLFVVPLNFYRLYFFAFVLLFINWNCCTKSFTENSISCFVSLSLHTHTYSQSWFQFLFCFFFFLFHCAWNRQWHGPSIQFERINSEFFAINKPLNGQRIEMCSLFGPNTLEKFREHQQN